MATKTSIFSSVISGSPMITSEKLVGSENYLSWSASVELWFMGQGYEDHLVTQEADIPEVERVQWRKIDAQLCSVLWQSVDPKILLHLRAYKTCFKFWTQAKGLYTNDIQRLYKVASAIVHISQQDLDLSTYIGQIASLKEEFLTVMPLTPDVGAQQTQLDKFFMVLTLIGLRPDLEPVRDQILGSSSVPSLDDVFARLLRISSTQTLPSDSISDSSVLVSHYLSRRTQCSSASQASQASVAQPGNASACLTHTSSLGPWILDSGASDHLSGNKDLFSSITTTSALPTVTLANGSQTVAKGIGLALPLPSLPLTSVLYTPECPFNLISISKITRTLNCSITFSDKFVTLQDRSTGKTIGIGRESQGLYHLTSDSSPAVCISTDAPLLIHSRLGHPSLSKFQKMVLVFPLCRRFRKFYAEIQTQFNISIRVLRSDNAREYFSAPFTSFMSHHGILHQSSCAHTPQQNGVAERKNRHLVETARTILLHSNIPHFLLFPDQPLYFLPPRVFGCTCFVHILTPGQDKLSAKAMNLALPIVSPSDVVPPRPLQVYHRRPRVAAPLPFAEAPADSLPIPSASPAPALPSPDDLPIAIRKGTRSTRNPHPIYNFLSYHRLSSPYSAFVSAISSVSLPKSTHEALSHPGWRQAMVDEMAALHSNGTWDLVVLPSGKSTVGCRWVYAVKVGPDGQVDRLKARLVAKGYTQVYGSDYGDTFSPVAKIASVRLLLSMAAMCSWPLYQLDIKNVFLHGDLAEEVYMEQPPGFVAQGSLVYTADHSVFYHHNSLGQCIYLVVYVDDIVITGSDQDGIQKLKQHLFTHFQTKDLGKLKYFLGIEIAQSSSGVVLSQRKYALDILEETGMLDCKPIDTPMDPNVKLVPGQGEPLGDPGRYRRLVGKLNYLTITRPDISFPVSVVSQFLQSPCDSHWDVVIRILRYIKSTPGQGVLYENRGHTQVVGYTDADWAGSPTDRRSTSGTVFLLEISNILAIVNNSITVLPSQIEEMIIVFISFVKVSCLALLVSDASSMAGCVFVDAGVAPIDIETRKMKEEMKSKEARARAVAEHGELALITVDGPQTVANERIALRPPMLQVVRLASFQHPPSVPPFLTLPKQSKVDGDDSVLQKEMEERKTNEIAVGGGGVSVAVTRFPTEQRRPVGPLVVVYQVVPTFLDRYMCAHALSLSHPGIRCRCLAAYGDAVSAVKWLAREHHDDLAQFMLGMGYATEALHLPGISKRLEFDLAMQSNDLKRALQCLLTMSNSRDIGQENTGLNLNDILNATAQADIAREALKRLAAAGSMKGALHELED
ncbi:Retrovirus-related Pol polyprotein from transposon TNT 1-94 [Vitis vinifera]|uniref:Retrovirus-related Pol polyprotein from transposon TNT 1-94 n=1 Tax=Vitis vinifera TaxID=29760 RepID=A0A438H5D5_VITVI|nr:Retrovirus-related Pol polyprotein from transposon TNT 1-94 [Vitis vinifera]